MSQRRDFPFATPWYSLTYFGFLQITPSVFSQKAPNLGLCCALYIHKQQQEHAYTFTLRNKELICRESYTTNETLTNDNLFLLFSQNKF